MRSSGIDVGKIAILIFICGFTGFAIYLDHLQRQYSKVLLPHLENHDIGVIDDAEALIAATLTRKVLPDFLKISGLPDVQLFSDMDASKTNVLAQQLRRDRYYANVIQNPLEYDKRVKDDRIYNIEKCQLLYQYHYYHFITRQRTTDDMKCDFLSSFLHKYHALTPAETDHLILEADEFR